MRRTAIYVAVSIIAFLGTAVLISSLTSGAIDQPVAFNHRVHVDDLGAECTDCHLYALTGMRATIPNLQTCTDCHEAGSTESPGQAKLLEYVASGESIPWRKIYWVPDHVYFSHRRHAGIAEIQCEVCHGPVGEQVQPVTRPFVPITMDACMECHDQKGVSNDCILCHR